VGLDVAFQHDFDGSVVEAKFSLTWLVPHLFRVDISGAAVGNGYMFGDICHYHMKFGDKFVEVTYLTVDEGLRCLDRAQSTPRATTSRGEKR
jgi:hypothetical protein